MQTYDIIGADYTVLGQVEATTAREAFRIGRQRHGERASSAKRSYSARPLTGDGLKAFRERLNLTQDEFCEKVGLSRRTLTTYEGYYARPVPKVVAMACRAVSNGDQPLSDPA